MRSTRRISGLLLALFCAAGAVSAQTAALRHEWVRVTLDKALSQPVSGRMLIFLAPASVETKDPNTVDITMMSPTSVYVAAKEVAHLAPGESVDVDVDDVVFPQPFSQAPAGSYRLQAVLDVHHSYNYDGRSAGWPPLRRQRSISVSLFPSRPTRWRNGPT
jgi:hypothetical protein